MEQYGVTLPFDGYAVHDEDEQPKGNSDSEQVAGSK